MRQKFLFVLMASILLISSQAKSQTTDSAAIRKSQERVEDNLKDARKHQRKIDRKQRKINRQERKINRQERRRDRKLKKAEKEQEKIINN